MLPVELWHATSVSTVELWHAARVCTVELWHAASVCTVELWHAASVHSRRPDFMDTGSAAGQDKEDEEFMVTRIHVWKSLCGENHET